MVPIIINNRDLLTWTKAMVDKLKTMDDVGDIIILDNASTYEPLLDWYKSNPCEIIGINNLGHRAPWESGLIDRFNGQYYIVTDPDLGIDDLPQDTIPHMINKLEESKLLKIGLGLDWERIKETSLCYDHLQTYEKRRWANSRIENGIYLDIHTDTTFAIYRYNAYFIGGGSLPRPYIARHHPWEFTDEQRLQNKEYCYYIEHANNSSTYKVFFNL